MGLRLNTPPVEVFDLGTTEVFVTENSRASLSRWFKPDSKWHFFFRSTLYHISEMASKMALFGCFRFMELAEIGRCRASVPPPQTPEGGGLPFRSCFRSSLRSSSAAVPQQLRSSSAAAPQQLRSSSAVVPCYLRSRSVLPPQSFRVTSAAQTKRPHHHRHRLVAHGGRLWLRCVHHHGNGRERESRGANPATDA